VFLGVYITTPSPLKSLKETTRATPLTEASDDSTEPFRARVGRRKLFARRAKAVHIHTDPERLFEHENENLLGAKLAKVGFANEKLNNAEVTKDNVKHFARRLQQCAPSIKKASYYGRSTVAVDNKDGQVIAGPLDLSARREKSRIEALIEVMEDTFGPGSIHRCSGPKPQEVRIHSTSSKIEYYLIHYTKQPWQTGLRKLTVNGTSGDDSNSLGTPDYDEAIRIDGYSRGQKRRRIEAVETKDFKRRRTEGPKIAETDLGHAQQVVGDELMARWATELQKVIKGKITLSRKVRMTFANYSW